MRFLRFLWDECKDFVAFLRWLYMLLCGDMLLLALASFGLYLACRQQTYIQLSGTWEQSFGMAIGVLLLVGSCGSFALRYHKGIVGVFRFRLQAAVRAAFLLTAPLATAMKWPFLVDRVGVWSCVAFPCLTIIPFGLSLCALIRKQRKS